MNDTQEIIKLLTLITTLVVITAGLLEAINKLLKQIGELWPRFRILLLMITQVLPVGGVIWYFMYFAAIYSTRLIEKAFFFLLVIYPTLLISSYEIFWGVRFYPKLLSNSRFIEKPSLSKSKSTRPHTKRS